MDDIKMPRIFYLKKIDNGEITAKFVVTNPDTYHSLTGECHAAISWSADYSEVFDWEYVADVYCKWDGCTHWWFRGEDYDAEFDNADSYYHLCGVACFLSHIRCMCFVWKLAYQTMIDSGNDVVDDYFDFAPSTELVDLMLQGYEIVEEIP